jgi:formimidoylglutamate deiminase
MSATVILPELTLIGEEFRRDVAVRVKSDGTIESVGLRTSADLGDELKRRALLPGFVNAHSHAFQRGLRARAQRFDTGSGNFWTWRDTMYELADSLDASEFYETCKQCFQEMLRAGITTVGEFHYLHHAGLTCDDWAFDAPLLSAARDSGIRLVLIQTYYATGNFGQELADAQKRFSGVSREQFLKQFDRLTRELHPATQTAAIACHSVRAAPIDDMVFFRDFSIANRLPFHIHIEEARKEIDDCRAAHGMNPLALLLDRLKIDDSFTAIHCTHSTADDLREYLSRGGRICLCPLTEGNLSDGFPDVPTIRECGGQLCFGTDSNIRISANEELRWMEFAQRLRRERRGVIADTSGSSAAKLHEIGTRSGARALGLRGGGIAPGNPADLIAIDLDHLSMRGATDDAILDSLIFGCGNGPIDHVWVAGNLLVKP